jgi:hypothetical protein
MMRNLIEEVRTRRVLAFAALGVLVALALPLLFLKSAPEGAPAANSAAPAAAEPAKLPARAARLLATNDAATARGQAKGASHDPFNPPAAFRAAADAGKGGAAAPAKASTPTVTSGGGGGSTATKPAPAVTQTPAPSPANNTVTPRRTTSALNANNASVDIRFGPKADTKLRRGIPRQKAFYIHGKLVAMFVKYSPSRKAAVFAVAPGMLITGPVKCRAQDGACRYLDIPAGAHAWLTIATPSRTIVSRRLDVVRIKRRKPSSSTRATAAGDTGVSACLLGKLLDQKAGDALLDRDACKRS